MTTSAKAPSPAPSAEKTSADEMLLLLRGDGVVSRDDATLTPLTGGVSSEIYLVRDGPKQFVVKRALRKLKVKDDWFADPRRNLNEQAYLRYVETLLPAAVPKVTFASEEHFYFAMEYLGDGYAVWKQQLLAGRCDPATTKTAAEQLATIHAASRGNVEIGQRFNTTHDFVQLRVDPYLTTTGQRHPKLQAKFDAEGERLSGTHEALVHGDYSPKNLLVGNGRVVILDCEVAWYGDPAFDLSFLMNHLLLKALYHDGRNDDLAQMAQVAANAYAAKLGDEVWSRQVADRTACLLPMLLLARVDGKSPVEYLTEDQRQFVRDFVYGVLSDAPPSLDDLRRRWFEAVSGRAAGGSVEQ